MKGHFLGKFPKNNTRILAYTNVHVIGSGLTTVTPVGMLSQSMLLSEQWWRLDEISFEPHPCSLCNTSLWHGTMAQHTLLHEFEFQNRQKNHSLIYTWPAPGMIDLEKEPAWLKQWFFWLFQNLCLNTFACWVTLLYHNQVMHKKHSLPW